jgi:hypothetical protein
VKEPRSDASDDANGALAYDFHVNNSGVGVLHDSDDAAPVKNSTARMVKDNEGVAMGSTSTQDIRSDCTDDTDNTGGAPAKETRSADSEGNRIAPSSPANMLVDMPSPTEDDDVPPAVYRRHLIGPAVEQGATDPTFRDTRDETRMPKMVAPMTPATTLTVEVDTLTLTMVTVLVMTMTATQPTK